MPGLPDGLSVSCLRHNAFQGLLTRNASRDDNEVGASEGLLQTIILGQVAGGFLAHCVSDAYKCVRREETVRPGTRCERGR